MYVFAKCAAKVRFFPETAKLSSDYFFFGKEKSPSSPQTDCPAPAFYILLSGEKHRRRDRPQTGV